MFNAHNADDGEYIDTDMFYQGGEEIEINPIEETHFERVCAEFAQLIEDYGTVEVFKELPDGVVFDICSHLEDIQR